MRDIRDMLLLIGATNQTRNMFAILSFMRVIPLQDLRYSQVMGRSLPYVLYECLRQHTRTIKWSFNFSNSFVLSQRFQCYRQLFRTESRCVSLALVEPFTQKHTCLVSDKHFGKP
uniref:Uncharacterized protein n=1 Tax=Mucochytrium quahogii TaxID=96639 RepID=A0A7S2WEL2_9STRA